MTRAKTSRPNPVAESARARLRAAQEAEAAAVGAVHAAVTAREKAQAKLDAAIAQRQTALDEVATTLARAYADLVAASGVDRAALILDVPKATLKAASARAAEPPSAREPIANHRPAMYHAASGATDELAS
jgi:hypothetical protein